MEDNKPIIKASTSNSKKYDTKIDIYTSDPKGPHDSIHIAVDSDTKTANNIHIAICEKMFPKFWVYISNNLLIIPNINPTTNKLVGFSIILFKISSHFNNSLLH